MIANIIRNAKKTVTGGDPYYSAVSLLLPMDGTNGSTTFADSGPNALAVTAVGNAQISTTQSKFGGASGAFDGTGDYLSLSSNSIFAIGTTDFTVEFWMYITSRKTHGYILYTQGGSDALFVSFDAAGNYLRLTNSGTVYAVSPTLNLNQWYHIAVVRSSGSSKVYVDGVGGTAVACSASFVQSGPLIGGASTANYFQGYIDDLRITKFARYTSAFTPPTQAFPNIYNPYTTLPVSGAALWLDASQQNTIFTDAGTTPVTTSGQSVYQWNDLSGNNRHAIQATSGNRPTWVPPASGQNGLGVVGFNGSSSFVEGSWQTFDPLSIYMVFKHTSGTTGSRVFTQSDATNYDTQQVSGSTNWVPLAVVAGPAISSYSTTDTSIGSVSLTSSTWLRIKHLRNGTSIVNSVTNTTSSTTISAITRAMTKYTLGRVSNFNGGYVGMQVGECVAFNKVLSTSEETSMTSYLQAKWGTP